MRGARFLLAALVALAASGCMRRDPDAAADRGLFAMQASAPQAYAQQRTQPPSVLQYVPQPAPAPRATEARYRGASPAAPSSYAYAAAEQPYMLGPGDKLRVVVFGQDGISNTYIVDTGGNVSLPLIGSLVARGITTQQLSARIAERLKQGYVRDPHVTVEVESYRPFFILGEVTTPGQYPYVADMTVEKAIAIAGGFAPRAYKSTVELTRSAPGDQSKSEVPLNYPLRPGDTVMVKERWF
jgi:protein involved in polysaccharide export with SLBB domain